MLVICAGAFRILSDFIDQHKAEIVTFKLQRKQIRFYEGDRLPNVPGEAKIIAPEQEEIIAAEKKMPEECEAIASTVPDEHSIKHTTIHHHKRKSYHTLNLVTVTMTVLCAEFGSNRFIHIVSGLEDLEVVHCVIAGHTLDTGRDDNVARKKLFSLTTPVNPHTQPNNPQQQSNYHTGSEIQLEKQKNKSIEIPVKEGDDQWTTQKEQRELHNSLHR